jgi:hypothetical protein
MRSSVASWRGRAVPDEALRASTGKPRAEAGASNPTLKLQKGGPMDLFRVIVKIIVKLAVRIERIRR